MLSIGLFRRNGRRAFDCLCRSFGLLRCLARLLRGAGKAGAFELRGRLLRLFLLLLSDRLHRREQQDVADRRRVGEQHAQAVKRFGIWILLLFDAEARTYIVL